MESSPRASPRRATRCNLRAAFASRNQPSFRRACAPRPAVCAARAIRREARNLRAAPTTRTAPAIDSRPPSPSQLEARPDLDKMSQLPRGAEVRLASRPRKAFWTRTAASAVLRANKASRASNASFLRKTLVLPTATPLSPVTFRRRFHS